MLDMRFTQGVFCIGKAACCIRGSRGRDGGKSSCRGGAGAK